MILKLASRVNLLVGTALTVAYAAERVHRKIKKIAETETVYSEKEYVLVRFCRGDYIRLDGYSMMKNDYKFYQIITTSYDD